MKSKLPMYTEEAVSFNKEELKKLLPEIFYKYMTSTNQVAFLDCKWTTTTSTNQTTFFEGEWVETGDRTPTDIWRGVQKAVIEDVKERVEQCKRILKEESSISVKKELNNLMKEIEEEYDILKNNNMSTQKEHKLPSCVPMPLKGYLSPLYDNLVLEVLFYNDVYTIGGKYEQYKSLSDQKSKIKFYKENTEILNIAVESCFKPCIQDHDNYELFMIPITGEVNEDVIKERGIALLDPKYVDFQNLTEADMKDAESLIKSTIQHSGEAEVAISILQDKVNTCIKNKNMI